MTVIEAARKKAGLSQRRLADHARTTQSAVSEYESRRKSPTLAVVERLLDAADAELAVKPMVFFDYQEDPEIGLFGVPDRLWSVPLPECFARVQVLKYIFHTDDHKIWDLSDPVERIEYYELALVGGVEQMLLDSVDGVLFDPGVAVHASARRGPGGVAAGDRGGHCFPRQAASRPGRAQRPYRGRGRHRVAPKEASEVGMDEVVRAPQLRC
jgi:transcriptional regulator with XRE-family HTH domain